MSDHDETKETSTDRPYTDEQYAAFKAMMDRHMCDEHPNIPHPWMSGHPCAYHPYAYHPCAYHPGHPGRARWGFGGSHICHHGPCGYHGHGEGMCHTYGDVPDRCGDRCRDPYGCGHK